MPIALNANGRGAYARADVLPPALFELPDIEGLTGAYMFTAGARFGLVNLVPDGVQPTQVGQIVWEQGFAAMSRATGHVDTNLPETLAATMVFVGKRAAAAGTPFIGNYIDGARRGIGMYSVGSQQSMSVIADRGSTDGLAVTVIGTPAAWRLYSGRVPAAAPMTIVDHTAGVTVVGTQTAPRVIEDAGTIKIGAFGVGSSFNGVAHLAVAVIANRVLTAAELAAVVAWAREAAAWGEIAV